MSSVGWVRAVLRRRWRPSGGREDRLAWPGLCRYLYPVDREAVLARPRRGDLGGRIHAPAPRSRTPSETELSRRERRQRRNAGRRARRRVLRRRALLVLPVVAFVAGLVFFLSTAAEQPVSRVQVPTAAPGPEAPLVVDTGGDEAETEDADLNAAGGRDEALSGVEVGLSSGETGDLRGRIGRIAQAYPGRYGVVVLDPSSGRTVTMGPDKRFLAASINKLPVLLTLYKSAAAGTVDLEDPITMQASDIQAYGTGSLQLEPVGTTMTLRECATYLIKESDNTAWKMLDRYLGRDYIRSELYSVGATSTEYWIPNTTTPNDVLTVLEKISDPSYTSPELSAEMLDLMTNTDFEDRLPQLLPEGAKVSHKIGSYGDTFGDAGVVFPKSARGPEDSYYIVVLASNTGEGTARAAMQEMSLATYKIFTGSQTAKSSED